VGLMDDKTWNAMVNNHTWTVEVGKGKSAYETRYRLDTERQAIFYYNGVNIGNGYKKRLVNPNGEIVARQFS
jgi:hypothetical protein